MVGLTLTLIISSLVPRPPPLLSVIRTASDDSCSGGLGTRLQLIGVQGFVSGH